MQNCWHPQLGKQRNLDEIGMGAASKSMLLFHTPSVVKVVMIVGLSLITLMCLQQMQNCWHPQLGEQRNLNEIGMGAASKSMLLFHTPYCSQSSNNSWFVSYYAHVPTINAKLLTPSARGATKFELDRNGCSKKKYVTIPYSNCSQSSNNSWFVSYYAHVPRINAKLLTPSARGATKFGRDRNGCNE